MSRRRTVLLVEDEPGDVLLLREAFSGARGLIELALAEDGEKALSFLRRDHALEPGGPPCLVLLDLNLPRKDGFQVLRELRGDPRLRCLPVVVLTTSASEADVQRAYSLGANCFFTKPSSMEGLTALARLIEEHWLSVAKLPL